MRWRETLPGFLAAFAIFQLTASMLGSERGEHGLVVAAIVVCVLAGIDAAERREGVSAALGALGFRRPRSAGLAAAVLISLLLLAFVPAYIAITGAAWRLYPGWAALLPGLFAQGGIAEEALFRGFLFGRLRQGRSFWHAVLLATLPFIVAHLFLFVTLPFPVALASVLLSTLISLPLANSSSSAATRSGHRLWCISWCRRRPSSSRSTPSSRWSGSQPRRPCRS